MNAITATPPRHRDRAVVQTVSAGRREISETVGGALRIDRLRVTERFTNPRLAENGPTVVGRAEGVTR
jgi:hypothetical protein